MIEKGKLFGRNLELSLKILNYHGVWGCDFNTVRSEDEKIGVVHNLSAMIHFSQFIDEIDYMDLPMSGSKFIWCSNRRDPSYSKLDRFLISLEFFLVFQNFVQQSLPRSLSNHNTVRLMVDAVNWGLKPFKFFNH